MVKLLFSILFLTPTLFLLGQLNRLDPAHIKYISVDPSDSSLTVAWYASKDDVNKLELKSVEVNGNVLNTTLLTSFNQNEESELNFKVNEYKSQLGTESYTKPVSIMTDVSNSAGNTSDALSYYHSSMFAEIDYVECAKFFSINWTPYAGKGIDIEKYELFRAFEDEPDQYILKSFNTDNHSFRVNYFTDEEVCYYIQVTFTDLYNNKQTATSNKTCIEIPERPKPDFVNPNYIIAQSNDSIEVSFTVPGEYWVYEMVVFDENDEEWELQEVMSSRGSSKLGYSGIIDDENFTYSVNEPNIATEQNTYLLYVYEGCDKSIDSNFIFEQANSSYLTNIVLENSVSNFSAAGLKWNRIDGLKGGVDHYEIFRSVAGEEFEMIEKIPSFSGDFTEYSDNIKQYSSIAGNICYYIEAVEGVNPNGITSQHSRSNTICIKQESRVFVANTLIPNSSNWKNREIKPVMSYVSPEDYSFIIYDQWGNIMFETTDMNESWNGKKDGEYANQACYTYYLMYKTADSEIAEQRGIINIIYLE